MKKLINTLSIVFLLGIIINSFFIYPSADDYSYFVKQNDYGFWEFQRWHYLNWGGRYIPNFVLGSFDFAGFGLYLYRIIAVLITLFLYLSFYFFIKKIVQPKDSFYTTNLIFLAYCFSLFSISQAFYWMPGSITYTLSLALCLLTWTLLDRCEKIFILVLNILLVFVLNGTNEISMLFYNGSILGYLAFRFWQNKKINFPVLFLFIISFGCMLLAILAPGNTVRTLSETNNNTHQLVYSATRSVYRAFTFTAEKFFIYILIAFLVYPQLTKRNLKILNSQISNRWLIVFCVLFPAFILCFGIFPSYFATGRIPPERTVNTISFFFLIAILFSLQFYKDNNTEKVLFKFNFATANLPIIFGLIIFIYPNELRNNLFDLLSGKSIQFAKEMNERENFLRTTKEQNIILKKNSTLPNTLLFKDITGDKDNFFNHYYTRFFNKKSIIVHE